MSEENTVVENTEQAAEVAVQETSQPSQVLAPEQEVGALRRVHEFMTNFDRVPGSLAVQWGQALDTIAVVANSLIEKMRQARAEEPVQEETAN